MFGAVLATIDTNHFTSGPPAFKKMGSARDGVKLTNESPTF